MRASSLTRDLRAALAKVAEPERAAPMQAYAKSAMPYLGVTTPARRKVRREVFAGLDLPTAAAWRRTVLALWRGARYREERYAAIDLTESLRKAIGWALRQYAWTDPTEVRRYVREHEKELCPLSKREALKNVAPAARAVRRSAAGRSS